MVATRQCRQRAAGGGDAHAGGDNDDDVAGAEHPHRDADDPQDTVALDWQDVEDADSYAVRFVLDDQWVELPSDGVAVAVTGSSAVVSNLPDYDHYYFAVRAGKGR